MSHRRADQPQPSTEPAERALSRVGHLWALAAAAALAAALLLTACGGGDGDDGGDGGLSEDQVRACLKKGEKRLSKQGLVFLVVAKQPQEGGEPLIGVDMTDIQAKDPSAFAQIVLSDSDEFIDRWEEEMKKDPAKVLVTRSGNAVVTYDTKPTGLYAKGQALIDSCIRPAGS